MPPRTRSQAAAERIASTKRSRDESCERPSKRSRRTRNQSAFEQPDTSQSITPPHCQSQSLLFAYPFMMPLVLQYLMDINAICLGQSCKSMRPFLCDFAVGRFVEQSIADQFLNPTRFLCYQARSIKQATQADVSRHRQLHFLSFHNTFNEPILPGMLGKTMKYLFFGDDFNQSINQSVLPIQLDHLSFGKSFNQPINQSTFPSTVTRLQFGSDFNQPVVEGSLPPSLQHLTFGTHFNQPIKQSVLPHSLTELHLRSYFNQPLIKGSLPSSLKVLDLGFDFDHPIEEGMLPNGLTHLFLSFMFNLPIGPNVIPSSVTHLAFGTCFNQPINRSNIPPSVERLTLGENFHQMLIPRSLPNSIKHIVFNSNNTECIDVDSLPSSVEHLELGVDRLMPNADDVRLIILPGDIPSTVKRLTLHRLIHPDSILPSTIIKLDFGPRLNQEIPLNLIPQSVTHVTFGEKFNQPLLPGSIPSSVTHIKFGHDFCQSLLGNILPNSILFLTLGESFDPNMLVLPPHLTHIHFHKSPSFEMARQIPETMTFIVMQTEEKHVSGHVMKTFGCVVRTGRNVAAYLSWDPIDMENFDPTNLQPWTSIIDICQRRQIAQDATTTEKAISLEQGQSNAVMPVMNHM